MRGADVYFFKQVELILA